MVAPSRLFASLVLALAVLLPIFPSPAQPTAAQAATPILSGTPGSLAATVALGATTTLSLALHNNQTTQSVTPRLYEAFAPSSGASTAAPKAARVGSPDLDGPASIDPQIAALQAAAPDGRAEVIVLLDGQADLSAAYTIRDWYARGQYVYDTLRSHAEATQRDLRAALEGHNIGYTPLWIVNGVAVEASAADVAAIASVPSVASMWASRLVDLGPELAAPLAQGSPGGCSPDADNACWNIGRVGATRAWKEFGVRGEGITVASLDSGVRLDHPALRAQYRGSGPSGLRHDHSWFDPYAGERAPVDSGNHGTHTMGTMVGRGLGDDAPAVGVAPGASWIAARACSARNCDEVDLIRAAQWMIAPTALDGSDPRPDLRPHVINNSWTGGRNTTWFMGYVDAWRAAGMYPVFAGGNTGSMSTCGTIESPADYAQVTGVGATDGADALASFSGIGPTLDGRLKPDLVAPGQGVVSTVADGRQYAASSGTSMAAPHVAGTVALLWQANPELIGDYETTYALLTGSAAARTGDERYFGAAHERCRPTGTPNNIYGYGRLDVYSAVAQASVDVPWLRLPAGSFGAIAPDATVSLAITLDARLVPGPGEYVARVLIHGPDISLTPAVVSVTMHVPASASQAVVSGQLTRADDGKPIEGTVRVAGGATVSTDTSGRYSVTLPPATAPYTLTAAARGYVAAALQTTVGGGERRTLNFALAADRPRLAAEREPRALELGVGEREQVALPLGNQGSQTLSYSARVLDEHYGVWRSDEPDGPAAAWTDPPATAVTVSLGDDAASARLPIGFSFPYYYERYEYFSILANGVIAFAPLPAGDPAFLRSCLPLTETPGAAIAVLRLDLDPSKPGARVSYAGVADGLLVTWEDVPLYNSPQTLVSFQALLMRDGRISMRYRDTGPLGPGESEVAGLQRTSAQHQRLGCGADLGLSDGLTVELRPQAPATVWLSLGSATGTVAPGATAGLPLTASWISARAYGRTLSGAIELRSNDPALPVMRLTVRMRTGEAPHVMALPVVNAP